MCSSIGDVGGVGNVGGEVGGVRISHPSLTGTYGAYCAIDAVKIKGTVDASGIITTKGIKLSQGQNSDSMYIGLIDKASNEDKIGINFSGTGNILFNTTGNVGIGTTNPGANKLKVEGAASITEDLTVGGAFNAGGADLAEEFTTEEEIEERTVVIMGDNGYKSAKPCDSEYDTKVIGVVSDNPAVIMGRVNSEHKAIIAISGVDTVKVSVINGIIKKGDLLTTSNIAGYAMKATDAKIGTIIGKALEECDNGKCEIKALINLQ